jgi:eukaryotic-like serine/threonine-protein kinase
VSLDLRDLWLGSAVLDRHLAPRNHLLAAARQRAGGDPRPLSQLLVEGGVLTQGQLSRLGLEEGTLRPEDPLPAWLDELNKKKPAGRTRAADSALVRPKKASSGNSDAVETLIDTSKAAESGTETVLGAPVLPLPAAGATLIGAPVLDPAKLSGSRPKDHSTVKLPLEASPQPRPATDARPASEKIAVDTIAIAGAIATGKIKRKAPSGKPTQLGAYEVLEEIGRGGMGVVYRGHAPNLDRTCAIKVRTSTSDDLREICRFQNEAVLAARLRHPNIVGVFDAGEDEGRFYLVMEYVEGVDFAVWISQHKSPDDLVVGVRVLIAAAEALGYAHAQGVVHRDVKPDNVLVTSSGEARVTDFGVARGDESLGLTREGRPVGTLNYVPPEQANGELEAIGPRSDVYGLGATLYHLLAGDAPYADEEGISVYYRVLRGIPPPAPSGLAAERGRALVAPELDWICARAMEPKAEDRYPSAEAFAADLRAFLEGRPVTAEPVAAGRRLGHLLSRHRARLSNAALALTVLVLTCAAAWGVSGAQGEQSAQALTRQDERAALEHAATVAKAVRVDMLTGRPDLVRTLTRDLAAEGSSQVTIARIDGSLAYRDAATRKAVTERLSDPALRREAEARFPELAPALTQLEAIPSPPDQEPLRAQVDERAWAQALSRAEPQSYGGGDQDLVVLYPLLNAKRCQVCHGPAGESGLYASRNNRVRGVVIVRRSQDQLRGEVEQANQRARQAGLGTAVLLALIVLLLLRLLGLRPRTRTFGVAADSQE